MTALGSARADVGLLLGAINAAPAVVTVATAAAAPSVERTLVDCGAFTTTSWHGNWSLAWCAGLDVLQAHAAVGAAPAFIAHALAIGALAVGSTISVVGARGATSRWCCFEPVAFLRGRARCLAAAHVIPYL